MADKKVTLTISEYLQVLTLVASLWKALLTMIETIEDSNADGQTKKSAVLSWASALLDAASGYVKEIPALKDFALAMIDKLIDAIVATYNKIGKFVHKGQ